MEKSNYLGLLKFFFIYLYVKMIFKVGDMKSDNKDV